MQLAGKVALVTGAQQGIGRAIAIECAAAGADIAVNWLDDEAAAREVAASVVGHNRRTITIQADMAKLDEVREMVAAVVAEFGAIDILVNNAGVFPRVDFLSMTEADWDFVHDVNLKGAVGLCRFATEKMRAQRSGNVILVSSTAGQRGEAEHAHYAATKGALISLTKSLAPELAKDGIRVNCVAPGWVETDMVRGTFSNAAQRSAIEAAIPLGRVGRPEEIASAILYLASDLSSFVTGEILNVNGGAVLVG